LPERSSLSAAAAVLALAWPAGVAAQDAHYWTYGYGPIGQLTEGTLVGGVSDLSAVYYNPGALALLKKPRFVVGLTSVELANIKVPGAAGQGLDADQLVFDIVPSMVAGSVGGQDGADHFAFAFLSRHDSDWDLGLSQTTVSASEPDASAGFGRLRQRLVEYWVGGTWSHRLSDRLSVGVSPFFAYRAQRSRRSLEAEEIAGGESGAFFVAREQEYNHVRLLAKAGLAWRPGSWELGTTFTTPGLALWSQGKTVFNASVTGDVARPLVSATKQTGLHANYHAPWAVAVGATHRRGGTAIHATAEWFSAVGEYDILQPEPAPVAGTTDTIPLVYRGQTNDVFCYGLGLEHRIGSRVVLYAGAAHNESAYVPQRDSFAAWDLTDFTAGLTYETSHATFAFGLGYAWGSNPVPPAILPPETTEPASPNEARFSRWTISFGASFHAGS
jgi:long-subunit fatty acid transport protein